MPLSMLEAMAEGRAILVSDAGNMRQVVEETGCGWVLSDRRPATIAAALRRIADDPLGLGAAAASARKSSEASFSASAHRDAIDAILAAVSRT
jgi:glycosyltransferase involved in cell wall biosynthesis